MKKKLTNALMFLCLIMILILPIDVAGEGIELHGRVYDANQKYLSINDADLIISVCQREPELDYPLENGTYKAVDFGSEQNKSIKIEAYHPTYLLNKSISFRTAQWKEKRDVIMNFYISFGEI